jgi:hypothetical protein
VTSFKSGGQAIPHDGHESRNRMSYILIHPSFECLCQRHLEMNILVSGNSKDSIQYILALFDADM